MSPVHTDNLMAEGVGFEPTRATRTPLVFETSALNRSAIPPDPQNRLPKPSGQGNIYENGRSGDLFELLPSGRAVRPHDRCGVRHFLAPLLNLHRVFTPTLPPNDFNA